MTTNATRRRRARRRPADPTRLPPAGARTLTRVLAGVRHRDRQTLCALELDWPGSRALLARLAVALGPSGDTLVGRSLAQALAAYDQARQAGVPDAARFAAFVGALEAALGPSTPLRPLLTPRQRAVLADAPLPADA
jgi:hypothetical protein